MLGIHKLWHQLKRWTDSKDVKVSLSLWAGCFPPTEWWPVFPRRVMHFKPLQAAETCGGVASAVGCWWEWHGSTGRILEATEKLGKFQGRVTQPGNLGVLIVALWKMGHLFWDTRRHVNGLIYMLDTYATATVYYNKYTKIISNKTYQTSGAGGGWILEELARQTFHGSTGFPGSVINSCSKWYIVSWQPGIQANKRHVRLLCIADIYSSHWLSFGVEVALTKLHLPGRKWSWGVFSKPSESRCLSKKMPSKSVVDWRIRSCFHRNRQSYFKLEVNLQKKPSAQSICCFHEANRRHLH